MTETKTAVKWGELPQVNPNAAGLDVSAAEIVACVPRDRAEEAIRSFGTYTPDLHALAHWLKECGVETVAMEATGVYWIPVYEVLEGQGFGVHLVNARHVKNVPGRKSDVSDAQWIQTLHSYGLLRDSFLPDESWRVLRVYWRQRTSLIEHRAPHIQHMQRAMQHMNLQLTQALSDITGATGMQIIRAIVAGERNPVTLAQFRDPRCKHCADDIAKALTGNYREEWLYVLKQALDLFDFYTAQIAQCDVQIEREYERMHASSDQDYGAPPPLPDRPKSKSHIKNAPAFDARSHLYRLTGVDLVAVTGLEESTVQTILSEIGTDMSRWRTQKHFSSWLALAPHNDITGGKVVRSRVPKRHSRAGQAFRMAARSVSRSDSAFGAYFRRLASHLGVEQATVATAHKIARTVYAMLKNRTPFQEMGADEYESRHRERVVARLRYKARTLGFSLVPQEAPSGATF